MWKCESTGRVPGSYADASAQRHLKLPAHSQQTTNETLAHRFQIVVDTYEPKMEYPASSEFTKRSWKRSGSNWSLKPNRGAFQPKITGSTVLGR